MNVSRDNKAIRIGFVVLALVAVLLAGRFESSDMAAPSRPAIDISVADLESAFDKNEVAALQRFSGNAIRVTGIVTVIASGASDEPFVRFAGEGMDVGVSFVSGSTADVAKLEKGKPATVICETVGEVLGNPDLDDCQIQPAPRFNPDKIEAMKAQLLDEPKIVDLLYDPSARAVTWQVGVFNDGSRRTGYAAYICQLLRDERLVDPTTNVRIVDIAKVSAGANFRDASLGHIRCADDLDLGT